MSLSNILKDCAYINCRQADFFPDSCPFCGKIFCPTHHDTTVHHCSKANFGQTMVICSKCLKTMKYKTGIDTKEEACHKHWVCDCQITHEEETMVDYPVIQEKKKFSITKLFEGALSKMICGSHKRRIVKV